MTEDDALHRLYQGAIIAEGRGQTELATSLIELAKAIERAAGRTPGRSSAAPQCQESAKTMSRTERPRAPLLWLRRHIV
jgi:hypothetical protein